MAKSLSALFSQKKKQAAQAKKDWAFISQKIINLLDDEFKDEKEELAAQTEKINKARWQLQYYLENPVITIATTGTTSSGKSTVVNFLVGQEIMPTAVSETSAGLVTITHNPQTSILRIRETDGAEWETGEWEGHTADQIQSRLRKVMNDYLEMRERDEEPASPEFEIEFPTKIGANDSNLDLPEGFQLKLMDLPGLKYIGDESNARVIEKCREALCLVTYNSEETDPHRQKALLTQVVNQVKSLGGNPARMLFVFNRIDAFRKNEDYPDSENKFVTRTRQRIRNSLLSELPEYRASIDNLAPIRFSSEPAFLADQLVHAENNRTRYARKIAEYYSALIPMSLRRELPMVPEGWDENDYRRVSKAIHDAAFVDDFDTQLHEHVADNLPQLVLPQAIAPLLNELRVAASVGHQIVSAQVNRSDQAYKREKERLNTTKKELQSLLTNKTRWLKTKFNDLQAIFDFDGQEQQPRHVRSDELVKHADKILFSLTGDDSPYEQLSADDVQALSQWLKTIRRRLRNFLDEIDDHFNQEETKLQGELIDTLPRAERSELRSAYDTLIDAGFLKNEGDTIEAENRLEKRALKNLNSALNRFAEAMTAAMDAYASQVGGNESDRIFRALETIFENYVDDIWESIANHEHARKIGLGDRPAQQLKRIDADFQIEFEFEAGFPVREKQRRVKTGTKSEKVGEKRLWYTLYLMKKDIYAEKPVYEQRNYDSASIPSKEDLVGNWLEQVRHEEPKLYAQFGEWIANQFATVESRLRRFQDDLLSDYTNRLEKAHNKMSQLHDRERKQWDQSKKLLLDLEKQFGDLAAIKADKQSGKKDLHAEETMNV